MSFLSSITSGLSKAENFLINIFTKTAQVVSVVQKVGPSTLAAILAVFYDVSKLLISEAANVATATGDAKALNFSGALKDIFTPQTQTLLTNLVADFEAAETQVVTDFHELGISLKP